MLGMNIKAEARCTKFAFNLGRIAVLPANYAPAPVKINDLAEARGALLRFGNAQGRLEVALEDGRWEVVLLDETEASDALLKTIAERAPQLKVIIQTRKTKVTDWPKYETIAVGDATGRARAEIWARMLFRGNGAAYHAR